MNRIQALLLALLIGGIGTVQTGVATGAPTPAAESARAAGAAVYGKWCSDCHSTAGGPGSMAILNQRVDLAPDYVSQIVRHGVSFMPSFRKTEISDTELAQLDSYLMPPPRNLQRKASSASHAPGAE